MAIGIGRRHFITALGGTAVAWPLAASAQQSDRVRRIAVLMPYAQGDPEGQARAVALEQGLDKLGWVIGRNIRIDYGWGIDNAAKTEAATTELLALAPDVVMASTSRAAATLQQATHAVPIVFMTIYEPVSQGFVQSLAHPGGNATGFTNVETTVGAKWLELLKEIAPHVTRVAFMFNPDNPGPMRLSHSLATAAPNLVVDVVMAPVHGPAEIEAAMTMLDREPGGGLIVPPDGFLSSYRKLIIELAARYRLPALYGPLFYPAEGGLAAYGVKYSEQFRQAASYVDRILRGERAGDLPVQEPTKYLLVVNLKTAKALGLTIPHNLLVLADAIIE
jgi:putative tryptophan/tyrosine transport system substrate-binding protein